ncbi:MAG: hypothetical protein IBJ03_00490 [Gemmatimonadaceae bacterium]|nr:hypothetical protein [Gemmatimonadaceae bacterium]
MNAVAIGAVVLSGVLLGGCAAAPAAGVGAAPTTSVATGGSGARGVGVEVTKRADGIEEKLAATPAQVFAALDAVYPILQVPMSVRDPAKWVIGNEGLKFRRKLGDLTARRILDCGGTSGMPNADTYSLRMSILSSVAAVEGGQSRLTTVIQATAENPNFPGSGVSCSSTGVLEDRIAADVKIYLNARAK